MSLAVLLMLMNVPIAALRSATEYLPVMALLSESAPASIRFPIAVLLVPRMLEAFVGAASIFLLMTTDPGGAQQRDVWALRRFLTIVALVGLIIAGISCLARLGWSAVAILLGLCELCAIQGTLRYLHHLARRAAPPALMRPTGIVLWGLTCAVALRIVVIDIVFLRGGLMLTAEQYAAMILPPTAALLLFGGWYCVLLARYYVTFRRAKAVAMKDGAIGSAAPAIADAR
ncbi:MAG: hypothetical protein ACE5FI_19605 [Anaerolineales bacterium]